MQCECSRRPGSVPRSRRLGRTQFAPVMCSTNRFVGFDSPGILQCLNVCPSPIYPSLTLEECLISKCLLDLTTATAHMFHTLIS